MVKWTRSTPGIGLQQPPPGALAGVRLAGDQQHPQPVAHAVDRDHGAVVQLAHLARPGLGGDLHHRRAAALDRDGDAVLAPGRHAFHARRPAVAADGEPHRAGRVRDAEVFRHHTQLDAAPDDAEARRLDQPQAPVGFAGAAGQQGVEGRVDRRGVRHVVRLPVRQGDDAGEARARHLGQRPLQRREQARALVAGLRHLDDAEFEVGQAAGARFDGPPRRLDPCRAVADARAVARSTRSSAMSGRVSRVSSTRRGFPSASSSSANTPARSHAPARAAPEGRHEDEQRHRGERGQEPRRQDRGESRCRRGIAASQRASRQARAVPKPAKQTPASAVTRRSARR
jgi:hypothetical protein